MKRSPWTLLLGGLLLLPSLSEASRRGRLSAPVSSFNVAPRPSFSSVQGFSSTREASQFENAAVGELATESVPNLAPREQRDEPTTFGQLSGMEWSREEEGGEFEGLSSRFFDGTVDMPGAPAVSVEGGVEGPTVRPWSDFAQELRLRDANLRPGHRVLLDPGFPLGQRGGTIIGTVDGLKVLQDGTGKILSTLAIRNMDGFPLIRETDADGREYAIVYRTIGLDRMNGRPEAELVEEVLNRGILSAGAAYFGEDREAWRRAVMRRWNWDIEDRARALEAAWDAGLYDRESDAFLTYFMPFSSDAQFVQGWSQKRNITVKARIPMELVVEMETEQEVFEAMRRGELTDKKLILAPDERYESEYTWADTEMPVEFITDVFLPEDLIPAE